MSGSRDNTKQGAPNNKDNNSNKQQQRPTVKHEKGFLQKLKDVFWKDEEKKLKVEEIVDEGKDRHKPG